jgi:hypothetical protein
VGSSTVVTGTEVSTDGDPAVGSSSPTSTATCADGARLLGGGATVTQGTDARGAVSSSAPNASGTGWQATAVVTISGTGTVTVQSFAICAS